MDDLQTAALDAAAIAVEVAVEDLRLLIEEMHNPVDDAVYQGGP